MHPYQVRTNHFISVVVVKSRLANGCNVFRMKSSQGHRTVALKNAMLPTKRIFPVKEIYLKSHFIQGAFNSDNCLLSCKVTSHDIKAILVLFFCGYFSKYNCFTWKLIMYIVLLIYSCSNLGLFKGKYCVGGTGNLWYRKFSYLKDYDL